MKGVEDASKAFFIVIIESDRAMIGVLKRVQIRKKT